MKFKKKFEYAHSKTKKFTKEDIRKAIEKAVKDNPQLAEAMGVVEQLTNIKTRYDIK
jgi:hypothetical protein